jgi:integrase
MTLAVPTSENTTARTRRPRHPGIVVRHSRACLAPGGNCNCKPTYEAWVYSARDHKKIRETFPTLAAAKGWRADATSALRKGTLRAPSPVTLREAADAWLAGARDGSIRKSKGGDRYKPSAIRSYESSLRGRVLPDLGGARLAKIERRDLQDFADRLLAEGLDASTVRNTLMPVRAIYRRAVSRGDLAVNPTAGLELAAVVGRRNRIAPPDEAARLLRAVRSCDRVVWASAFYAGLRRGELQALRLEDVDLSAGIIRVERGWDDKERAFIAPKSRAGRRSVPILGVLRDYLIEHKLGMGRSEGLVFGATAERPFTPSGLWRRSQVAWSKTCECGHELEDHCEDACDAAGCACVEFRALEPIGLHEARHTFASLMIVSGVNAKAITTYMGHASIQETYDRYGHLFPGNENEAAALADAYLVRADTTHATQL